MLESSSRQFQKENQIKNEIPLENDFGDIVLTFDSQNQSNHPL